MPARLAVESRWEYCYSAQASNWQCDLPSLLTYLLLTSGYDRTLRSVSSYW